MLAYSSIAHAGYCWSPSPHFRTKASPPRCFYTAAYAAMNVGAFARASPRFAATTKSSRTSTTTPASPLRRPVLAALLGFFLLSLIGIPFTGGFFGKFYVFTAAIYTGHVWLAVIGLIN